MGAIGLLSAAIFCVLISQSFANTKYHVPVLIWGSNYEPSGSDGISYFSKVSSEDFTNQFLKNVHKVHKKPTVVVFIEETLSVEDFSLQKGSFPALKDIVSKNKKEFIQSVENPVSALSGSEIKSFGMSVINFEKGVDAKKGGVVYLVNLEDADSKEDRPQLLQRHDKKIAEIYNDLLKTNNDVIGVLTGNSASWTGSEEVVRVRRQANETNETDTAGKQPQPEKAFTGFHLETQTALIYTKDAPVLKIGDKEVVLPNPTSKIHDDRDKWQRAIFSYVTDKGKVNLRFRFENTSSYYWSLSQIELEGPDGLVKESPTLLTTKQYIGAPYGSSFHVSQPVVFRNKTISLTFTDMQVQPWKSPSGLQKKFSVAEDDTTFFTPAIWNGLIVTGLIGIILIWALTMITDIRTMDQFDDPKGKTITVNVTD